MLQEVIGKDHVYFTYLKVIRHAEAAAIVLLCDTLWTIYSEYTSPPVDNLFDTLVAAPTDTVQRPAQPASEG